MIKLILFSKEYTHTAFMNKHPEFDGKFTMVVGFLRPEQYQSVFTVKKHKYRLSEYSGGAKA